MTAASTSYSRAFSRLYQRLDEAEDWLSTARSRAPALAAELLRHTQERRHLLVRNSRRFRTPAVVERLLAEADGLRGRDPDEAMALAELAAELAAELTGPFDGRALGRDLAARAWLEIGEIRRLGGELSAAERAHAEADRLLETGSGDPLARAHWLESSMALRSSQGRPAAALELAVLAAEELAAGDEVERAAAAYRSASELCCRAGRAERAIEYLRRAADLLSGEQDTAQALALDLALLELLLADGRLDEADARSSAARRRALALGDHGQLLRISRLEGRIAAQRGNTDAAERALAEARRGFLCLQRPIEAALAGLDLLALYLARQQRRKSAALAAELVLQLPLARLGGEAAALMPALAEAAAEGRLCRPMIERATRLLAGCCGSDLPAVGTLAG